MNIVYLIIIIIISYFAGGYFTSVYYRTHIKQIENDKYILVEYIKMMGKYKVIQEKLKEEFNKIDSKYNKGEGI
jgi:hypothetical protein